MKASILLISVLLIFGCKQEETLDGKQILEQTIAQHDPSNAWNETQLYLHIQEPRIANPQRYSILALDNATNSFRLSRNRDQYLSEHIIDGSGNSTVLLNGETNIDTALVNKYRLDPARNIGYKNFYHLLYGLPMSLNSSLEKIIEVSETEFNQESCYQITIELKEPMISKFWNLLVSKSSMEVKGVEIIIPDNPDAGERLYFEGLITVNGIKIPRIRHWHELKNDTYSGTDIIVKELVD